MGICELCTTHRAILKRPKTGQRICKPCFYHVFEHEIHRTITDNALFSPGDSIAIAASGGKDSTVLAHIMTLLNQRHGYGLELSLLSIDEGIAGYRDDSLETVKRNQEFYEIPLKILSYTDLYGWSMDRIVFLIRQYFDGKVDQVGKKNNCTFCGVFRRQAIDRGAADLKVDWIVTGHNADDIAETVIMNILRGDCSRLTRCCNIATKGKNDEEETVPRCKPFKYTYEKEIVMYAYHKKLDYFSTECIYSPNAYRGHARAYLKDLEAIRRSSILDIVYSGEVFKMNETVKRTMATAGKCGTCGYISSNVLCKACVLLEGLNKGLPKLAISSE